MKTLQKITMIIAFFALIASCQSSPDVNKILSNPVTKKTIIDKIADDSNLSKEMIDALMNNNNGKMMMLGSDKMTIMMIKENQGKMMKLMKDNPDMMKSMMSDMMEACKSDTTLMCSMCKKMMDNPTTMDMMNKINGEKMDMKGMKGMGHKAK